MAIEFMREFMDRFAQILIKPGSRIRTKIWAKMWPRLSQSWLYLLTKYFHLHCQNFGPWNFVQKSKRKAVNPMSPKLLQVRMYSAKMQKFRRTLMKLLRFRTNSVKLQKSLKILMKLLRTRTNSVKLLKSKKTLTKLSVAPEQSWKTLKKVLQTLWKYFVKSTLSVEK